MAALAMTLAFSVGGVAVATPAHATHSNPQVNVIGHMDCGAVYEATWVWYEASNGERGWASTSDWTSVSRLAGRTWHWVKVKTYKLTLNNVDKDNGVELTVKVGCKGKLDGKVREYRTSFGVRRPFIGLDATRHICWDPPLGCWV